jgi:hypothetical protein
MVLPLPTAGVLQSPRTILLSIPRENKLVQKAD